MVKIISNNDLSEAKKEKLALLDLSIRGHKKIGRISMSELVNVSDAIRGIFDYV